MAFQSLILPIVSVFRSVGIQAARGALGGLNKDFETFAKQTGKAALAFAGMQALMASTRFITESVEITQQYERNMLALGQVFESVAPKMDAFNKAAAQSGISQSQSAQASVFLGSVLKQYGLEVGRTGDETQRLVLLAQDLATTYGYDLQEALLAITALFRGEYDPIEKFGVAMKQSEINTYLAARGLDDLEGSALLLEQVQARLTLLYERSADAEGAFARASDTLYGSQQKLIASTQNLQIAFGTPLQKPLSELNNGFAVIVEKLGPQFVDISETIGFTISAITPSLLAFTELFGQLIILFTSVLPILSAVLAALNLIIAPLTQGVSGLVELANLTVDEVASSFDRLNTALERTGGIEIGESQILKFLFEKRYDAEDYPLILEQIANGLAGIVYFLSGKQDVEWFGKDETTELKRFGNQAERTTVIMEEALPPLSAFALEMQQLGIYSVDAEGKMIGLPGLFQEIADAAAKSEASAELELMGFNASQIEYFLTKPDWAAIFGQISRLARIAAIDVASVNPFGTEFFEITTAQARLRELMESELGGKPSKGGAGKKPKDVVADLFSELQNEVEKQSAKLQLEKMGASEGLINLILGKEDWGKLWKQISSGSISLDRLQRDFNKTADGVKELEAATEKARQELEDYREKQQEEIDSLRAKLESVIEATNEFAKALRAVSVIDILPTTETELGRFEQQVVGIFRNIRQELQRGLEAGTIFKADYSELLRYVEQEARLLEAAARNRDELAQRYDLADSLIKEYRGAFTSALQLTGIISQLEKKTREVTVTQVTEGVTNIGKSLKDLRFSLTRSYTETIEETVDKSKALVDNFRDVATKARAFADNLRKLRDLGLDPQLFNQLVQAGVEAGGETAQALVDGGDQTINEINSLFNEIDKLGGNLGEEVATSLYGTGIDMADGLLAGIRSKQQELENAARIMAEAFNKAFNDAVQVSTGRVQADAEIPVLNAEMKKVQDQLAFAQKRLGEELGNLDRAKDKERRAAIQKKITAYSEDIKEFTDALAQITTQIGEANSALNAPMNLPVSPVVPTGVQTAGVVNNYTVNVTADSRLSGAKAGEAVVQQLVSYQNANGSITAVLGSN